MRKLLFFLATLGLTVPLQAQTGQIWAPEGQWAVEFNPNECVATRRFARGTETMVIGLQSVPASPEASLIVIAEPSAARLDNARLSTGGTPIEARGMAVRGTNAREQIVYAVRLTGPEFERLVASGQMSIATEKLAAALTLSGLGPLKKVLGDCNRDLVTSWGFPPEIAELSTPPKPQRPPSAYFKAEDYPGDLAGKGVSGAVEARVTVGLNGRARDCQILRSAGSAQLDEVTCQILVKRARFEPGRDGAGQPVEAPFVTSVRWHSILL